MESFSKASPIIFQLGPNNGNNIKVTIGYVHATNAAAAQGTLGADRSCNDTQTAAGNYISTIDAAISIISTRRGALGAVSNRLDSTLANLENMRANLVTAKGAVVDADFAEETADWHERKYLCKRQRLCFLKQMLQNNRCWL